MAQFACSRQYDQAAMLIAPPKALGTLREHLLPFARATVLAEIAKDFVKLPIPEIEMHLAGRVPPALDALTERKAFSDKQEQEFSSG